MVDVSFISLEKVLPFTIPFLKAKASVILLVKPQFEIGPGSLNKAGVVKDTSQYPALLENIKQMAQRNQLQWKAYMDSPILGGDGNAEFLGYFEDEHFKLAVEKYKTFIKVLGSYVRNA